LGNDEENMSAEKNGPAEKSEEGGRVFGLVLRKPERTKQPNAIRGGGEKQPERGVGSKRPNRGGPDKEPTGASERHRSLERPKG